MPPDRRPTPASRAFALMAVLACLGCAQGYLVRDSVAPTGCPAETITVSNHTRRDLRHRWTAQCQGRTFYCQQGEGGATCTQQIEETAGAEERCPTTVEAPPPGCQYDTQCRGERICEAGQCVNPSVAPATAP